MPVWSMIRLATGTVAACRCRGCSRVVGLSRRWERTYAIVCWLALALCFGLSIMEHSYAPYLGGVLVLLIAVTWVCRRPQLRVVRHRGSWFPVVNVILLGLFIGTLVYATPL